MIPILWFCFINEYISSLVNKVLPTPVPAHTVTISLFLKPYNFLFKPENGYCATATGTGSLIKFHKSVP